MKRISLEYSGTMVISESADGSAELFIDGESVASHVLYLLEGTRRDHTDRRDVVVSVSFDAPGVFDGRD